MAEVPNSSHGTENINDGTVFQAPCSCNESKQFRKQRQGYREIIVEFQDQGVDTEVQSQNTVARSMDQLKTLEHLFDGVKRVREMAYDSHAVDLFTAKEYHAIQKIQTNLTNFDVAEFSEKMSTYLGVNRISADEESDSESEFDVHTENWFSLGLECTSLFKKSPPFHFMYGSFETHEVEVKKRAVPRRNIRDKNATQVKPVVINKLDKSDRDKTTEEVESLLAQLNHIYERNDCSPICYFSFCVDPKSFAVTVENMFYVSFLIKDGAAIISLDESNIPVIAPIRQNARNKKENKEKKQFVTTLDILDYKEIIETFKIQTAVIDRSKFVKSG